MILVEDMADSMVIGAPGVECFGDAVSRSSTSLDGASRTRRPRGCHQYVCVFLFEVFEGLCYR